MAGNASTIQELRTSLEKSRWQLHDGLSRLQDRLQQGVENPPPMVEESVKGPILTAHPIHDLPEGRAARIMFAALLAGLAAGLSWSRGQS